MKPLSRQFSDIPVSIFAIMSALANEHKAINLGQGFPDTDGPEWVRKIAAQALIDGPNQYPAMKGVPALRQAVAADNKKFYGLDIDPETEVLITCGATEALADSFLALLNPGDEAIIIEPFFDCYAPQIKMAGGVPKFVRLNPPGWTLDEKALRAAFSGKTKLLVLNSPMNPCAKVFSASELQLIADLLVEYDAYCICDEVYEHLFFDAHRHIPLMTLPGMRERCVRIGSAGKTFSLTGWKIGYVTAPPPLLKAIAGAHQFVTYTVPPGLQLAVAKGFEADQSYYDGLIAQMDKGRRFLEQGLKDAGFTVYPCEGTYFLVADFSGLGFDGGDVAFCTWMTKEVGVTAIPMSVFYSADNTPPPRTMIRFCFAKKQDVLAAAVERMIKAFAGRKII